MLETTNRCNAECIMCPRDRLERPLQRMEPSLFERLVGEAAELGIEAFQLSFYGEPLMDPDLVDRVRLVRKRIPEAWIQIATNGSLLSPERGRALMAAGISQIRISIDGNDGAEYGHIRQNLDHSVLLENLCALKEARDGTPEFQTRIVVAGLNLERFPLSRADVRARWGPLCDEVDLHDEHDLDAKRPRSRLRDAIPCHRVFTMLPVLADGTYVLCIHDWLGETALGNAYDRTLKDAWEDQERRRVKRLHALGLGRRQGFCQGCTFRTAYSKLFA